MSDLVAFGCSNTFGHGLPDCFIPPANPGHKPSNFAWPSILADKLEKNCVNRSWPGSSNIQILWRLLNYSFKEDDVCIVLWTFFNRYPFSRLKSDYNYYNNYDHETGLKGKVALEELDEENLIIRNFICMNHAKLYLQSKNIKFAFLQLVDYNKDKYVNLDLDILPYGYQKNWYRDKAPDDSHPGLKSHQILASLLFKSNVLR